MRYFKLLLFKIQGGLIAGNGVAGHAGRARCVIVQLKSSMPAHNDECKAEFVL